MTVETGLSRLPELALPQRIMSTIAAEGGEVRFVGGVVRDVLRGAAPETLTDIDMAVNRPPNECRIWLEEAGFRVIPTGIDHGTITVVDHGNKAAKVELTTLRADIKTDGRHAEVAFGTDWETDASRRDFTINAIYLSADGTLYDPLGGQDDLARGRVRFVGDAAQRIQEDYLRMLRFFRFHARFGHEAPDAEAMQAITHHKAGLEQISGERIAQEMRGILAAGTADAIRAMINTGLDRMIAPNGFNIEAFDRLDNKGFVLESMHLLGFLIRQQNSAEVAARLRLSRKETALLHQAADSRGFLVLAGDDWQKHAYSLCRDGSMTARTMAGLYAVAAADAGEAVVPEIHDRLVAWVQPQFPVTGDDLISAGMAPGQVLGQQLKALERAWIDSDFTLDRDALLKRLDAGRLND